MPELPEVETVRRGLASRAVGREIADVIILRDRAVRRHGGGASDLSARLRGAVLESAVRRGKYLWLILRRGGSPGSDALVIHLGMSGQVLVRPPGADRDGGERERWDRERWDREGGDRDGGDRDGGEREGGNLRAPEPGIVHAHLRVRLLLAGGGELWFVDQRTFGHLLVAPLVRTSDGGPGGLGSDLPLLPEPVSHIARDALDPLVAAGTVGRAGLVERLRSRRTGLKRALLDQTLVSGIGNIYADEALWHSREHFERPATALTRARANRVLDAVVEVMTQALAAGGTSFDSLYVDVNGASGRYDRSLAVYGQVGRPCPRCGTSVVREAFMSRSSFRCPRCQARPRLPGPPGPPGPPGLPGAAGAGGAAGPPGAAGAGRAARSPDAAANGPLLQAVPRPQATPMPR